MKNIIDPRLDAITSCLYRVASKAIIVVDNKLLVVKEEQGWYGLPGGGVEHGQDIRESLVREIKEELGHTIALKSIPEAPTFVSTHGLIDGIPRTTLCYLVKSSDTVFPLPSELAHAWLDTSILQNAWLAPNIEPFRAQLVAQLV